MSDDLPKVVIPGDEPRMIAGSPSLDRLCERAEVILYDSRPRTDEEKVDRAREATIILNSRGIVGWPRSVLEQLPNLKMIACCAIGFDCVDIPAAKSQGIVVSNVPGRTASIVAEHALALLFGAARRLAFMTAEMKQGRWPGIHLFALSGKRLGVIGTGNIGCEMIRLAQAVGLEVVAWSYHPSEEKAERLGFEYVALPELLATSDAISVHVRLTDDSRGLLDAEAFAGMKPGALLVNTARGAIVESAALIDALESGRLGGAALDVFDAEPLPADDPLLACPHVVLTPHAADQLPEGMEALSGGAVDNIVAFLDGHPQNVVT